MRILAIDQGTTSTRGLIVTEGGETKVAFSRAHKQYYPQPGWVEHDPLEILNNIHGAIEAAGPVDAIAMANQGESCLAWDNETLEPLSNILVWQDERTSAFVASNPQLQEETRSRALLPFDSYFSAPKFHWMMENLPAVRSGAQSGRLALGTTDAWFLARLTGKARTDAATASRTSLMNAGTGQWDEELCRIFNVPMQALPPILACADEYGSVEIAGRQVPVLANMVDQQAALFGHGCTQVGKSKMTFGTGAFALAFLGEQVPEFHEHAPLPTLAWKIGDQTSFALDGGIFAASAALNWVKSLGMFSDYSKINEFDGPSAASRGTVFVPALFGLACPHWDRRATGAWFGLKGEFGADVMVQSVLEGIAFRSAEVIDSLRERIPLSQPLRVDGGLSQNPYFISFLADVCQCEIFRAEEVEQTAIGVARMAALAMGEEIALEDRGELVAPEQDRQEERARFTHAREFVQAYGGL